VGKYFRTTGACVVDAPRQKKNDVNLIWRQTPRHTLFVDREKVLNRIRRSKLWNITDRNEYPTNLSQIVKKALLNEHELSWTFTSGNFKTRRLIKGEEIAILTT
jgi:hypothetical protein